MQIDGMHRLVIRQDDKRFYGKVILLNEEIEAEGESEDQVEKIMRKKLRHRDISAVGFSKIYFYELPDFFNKFDLLIQSKVAEEANLSPGVFRQYVCGHRKPSIDTSRKIEAVLHELGEKLQRIKLCEYQKLSPEISDRQDR